jgi:hypothetical protein
MKADEIQTRMTELRQYDLLSGETQYRWDYSIYGVADKYRPGKVDEETWRKHARARAAAKIELMMAAR